MNKDLTLKGYSYHLPGKMIAQHPADKRDNSKLLVLQTETNRIAHNRFTDITGLIREDDMLVMNDTRVFPARLSGQKETGGKAEVFLLNFPVTEGEEKGIATATALIKSSKRPKQGSTITINESLSCTVLELLEGGKARLRINYAPSSGLIKILQRSGQVPLPPYINRKKGSTADDIDRYQTVYAEKTGAVAAPTAGLHFTEILLDKIRRQGTHTGYVTLHVGYGTFAPVRVENITEHQIHREYINIPGETVRKIEETRARGGRIWAVGTTTVRALEFSAQQKGGLSAMEGWCSLYIYPGFTFRIIDNLITNFHLPDSSLMFLVSAFCGRKTLINCYEQAIRKDYRFFSYGDAMAVITRQ
ncbi:MAG: tRNA preQ1(34) S-adenosylmethionine ribosyltransferase-isomerase QueA [Deltaproteobacteria bacterium]|nr:tRNA preQ1(34) S-adenosylmethionine ribosyltransferase-isomerase QueA [Deltaproteobacteria bacterium]